MLYLFGRLALSDSYYFNDNFHADEYPDHKREHPAPEATNSPVPSPKREVPLPAPALTKIAA